MSHSLVGFESPDIQYSMHAANGRPSQRRNDMSSVIQTNYSTLKNLLRSTRLMGSIATFMLMSTMPIDLGSYVLSLRSKVEAHPGVFVR